MVGIRGWRDVGLRVLVHPVTLALLAPLAIASCAGAKANELLADGGAVTGDGSVIEPLPTTPGDDPSRDADGGVSSIPGSGSGGAAGAGGTAGSAGASGSAGTSGAAGAAGTAGGPSDASAPDARPVSGSIACGAATCPAATQFCCANQFPTGRDTCLEPGPTVRCSGVRQGCDSTDDCPQGLVCCGTIANNFGQKSTREIACRSRTDCGGDTHAELCTKSGSNTCPNGTSCKGDLPGFDTLSTCAP